MTRTAWLASLDKDLKAVTADLGLPHSETQAFDGDGWVWAYRDYLDQVTHGESSRVAEVQVRARPDGLHDGPQLEIIATAWTLKSRHVAWSRPCAAQYVDPSVFDSPHFTNWLSTSLRKAWGAAHEAASAILEAPDPRQEAIHKLRKRGIRVRIHETDSDDLPIL